MNQLIILDTSLFLSINHLLHNELLDALAKFISGIGTAGIIWFILGVYVILKEEKRDHWFFAPLLFAGVASWLIVEVFIKPMIGRLRPTAEMGAIIVGAGNDGFSFPSGHATIAFAMAVVLSQKEPKWKWVFYALAVLISFSRIYLGKHYPLDVIGGAIIGWGIGVVSLKLLPLLKKNLLKIS